ncbi:MAG: SPOR domain-containing protein [Flavicella sp.]
MLANYITTCESISFETANARIQSEVATWKKTLTKDAILLENIGSLSQNKEGKVIFIPSENKNFLTDSYGLDSTQSSIISRDTNVRKEIPIHTIATSKNRNSYFRYAAAAAVLISVGSLGWNAYNQNRVEKLQQIQQDNILEKIQEATFTIENPLPTIELEVLKTELPKKYHLIAGAFENNANALKKVAQLKELGFNAEILGVNKWGLTQVTFESYSTSEEARTNLKEIKKTIDKEAWLFIQ